MLDAIAHPGRVVRVPAPPQPAAGLGRGAAAALLTLADADTPVWTDAGPDGEAWLRFHAGCPIAAEPQHASFVHAGRKPPPFAVLNAATAATAHRSTTLIVEVETLTEGIGWALAGPGIDGTARLAATGLPAEFTAELAANHERYPAGVDVFLCAGDRVAALPRSTKVTALPRSTKVTSLPHSTAVAAPPGSTELTAPPASTHAAALPVGSRPELR